MACEFISMSLEEARIEQCREDESKDGAALEFGTRSVLRLRLCFDPRRRPQYER
jgi:hypothetical protein